MAAINEKKRRRQLLSLSHTYPISRQEQVIITAINLSTSTRSYQIHNSTMAHGRSVHNGTALTSRAEGQEVESPQS